MQNLAHVYKSIGQNSFAAALADLGDLYKGEAGLTAELHQQESFKMIARELSWRIERVRPYE